MNSTLLMHACALRQAVTASALGPVVLPPHLPFRPAAGRAAEAPGPHIMNMAMGTRTLSRMRKLQKMKKASIATLCMCMCMADT